MDTQERIGLEVKVDFLYNVYQEWFDGHDYQDEPYNKSIKYDDVTRAIVTLLTAEIIDLEDSEDYAYFINNSFDYITKLLEQRARESK